MTPTADRRRASVLILDDEQFIAELLGELLDTRGYDSTRCASGGEAIELLAERDFDLIISDLRMPGMSGRDFYQRAVAANPGFARRIIFMSGDCLSEENQAFLRAAGVPHISKPFKIAAIERLVADTLQVPAGE